MIKAIMFDLDGTLVMTEDLKALSYAQAVTHLRPDVAEEAVVKAYQEIVGLSRQEVSEYMVRKFHLENSTRTRMQQYGVGSPWEVVGRDHLSAYARMIGTPGLLEKYQCSHTISLLHFVKHEGLRTGLATLSHRPETHRVLRILGLENEFDAVATREDVARGKPDPEIYLHISHQLGVTPKDSLVVEDSINGIRAAVAAGMTCIAVTSHMTRQSVHENDLPSDVWIVDDSELLMSVARKIISGTTADDSAPSLSKVEATHERRKKTPAG